MWAIIMSKSNNWKMIMIYTYIYHREMTLIHHSTTMSFVTDHYIPWPKAVTLVFIFHNESPKIKSHRIIQLLWQVGMTKLGHVTYGQIFVALFNSNMWNLTELISLSIINITKVNFNEIMFIRKHNLCHHSLFYRKQPHIIQTIILFKHAHDALARSPNINMLVAVGEKNDLIQYPSLSKWKQDISCLYMREYAIYEYIL